MTNFSSLELRFSLLFTTSKIFRANLSHPVSSMKPVARDVSWLSDSEQNPKSKTFHLKR